MQVISSCLRIFFLEISVLASFINIFFFFCNSSKVCEEMVKHNESIPFVNVLIFYFSPMLLLDLPGVLAVGARNPVKGRPFYSASIALLFLVLQIYLNLHYFLCRETIVFLYSYLNASNSSEYSTCLILTFVCVDCLIDIDLHVIV